MLSLHEDCILSLFSFCEYDQINNLFETCKFLNKFRTMTFYKNLFMENLSISIDESEFKLGTKRI